MKDVDKKLKKILYESNFDDWSNDYGVSRERIEEEQKIVIRKIKSVIRKFYKEECESCPFGLTSPIGMTELTGDELEPSMDLRHKSKDLGFLKKYLGSKR